MEQNNAAKFAFFYMLSLVALVFMALSTGMIIFQIINKNIIDVLSAYRYSGSFSSDQLKFAISALIIATPIFFVISKMIYKSLFRGELGKDSGIRKWLTYFILFISAVVMIGWLIGTINSFLDGELTTKFLLKAITAIGIAAAVFTFYLYDIRRKVVAGTKDKVIRIYFYVSLAVVLIVFVASLFIVESPTETRNRKLDEAVLSSFERINSAINEYYQSNNRLPADMEELKSEFTYLVDKDLADPETKKAFDYNIKGDNKFELCADFRTSNLDNADIQYEPYQDVWPHEAGYQCLTKTIRKEGGVEIKEIPLTPDAPEVIPQE